MTLVAPKLRISILAASVALFAPTALSFQVNRPDQLQFLDAVEKTTKAKARPLPPIHICDDLQYQPPDEDFYQYWFDNRIHIFGNTGILGGFHAAVAPLATKAIDGAAYEGEDIRTSVSKYLSKKVGKAGARVCDLCSGVGISTRALQMAFPDAEAIIGVDTSPEMISMARFLSKHTGGIRDISNFVNAFTETCGDEAKSFVHAFIERTKLVKARFGWSSRPVYAQGNAESTIFADGTFDLVTVFYGFHEIPRLARGRVLQESHRILQDGGKLAIVDISTDYSPSPAMLAGEPYVLEYSKNIHDQMESLKGAGFTEYSYETIVPGHVGLWLLTCEKDTLPQTSL
jgi:ubiquinone/menaquinone biosynthesis C-methylase UbiE